MCICKISNKILFQINHSVTTRPRYLSECDFNKKFMFRQQNGSLPLMYKTKMGRFLQSLENLRLPLSYLRIPEKELDKIS